MNELAEKKCQECSIQTEPLTGQSLNEYMQKIDDEWQLIEEKQIKRTFSFEDFARALDFTIKIGRLADSEGHHPEILLGWGKAEVTLWTHKIDGLSESDFVVAAKFDQAFNEFKE